MEEEEEQEEKKEEEEEEEEKNKGNFKIRSWFYARVLLHSMH